MCDRSTLPLLCDCLLCWLHADTGDGKPSSKPGKLLAKHKGKKQQELTGVLGWVVKKYKAVRHVARGTFNRVMRVGTTVNNLGPVGDCGTELCAVKS